MKDNWWTRFQFWLENAVHGDEWLQPVPQTPRIETKPHLDSIGHCLSYLEGMLLRQPGNSCPAIEESLRKATKWYKAKVFEP